MGTNTHESRPYDRYDNNYYGSGFWRVKIVPIDSSQFGPIREIRVNLEIYL